MKDTKNKGAYIVTGATGGIGKEIAMQLAAEGHSVILACRDLKKAEELKREIIKKTTNRKILYYQLSLESIDSIKHFGEAIAKDNISIYALINNAGTMCRNYQTNDDGLEMTMAVNLIGTVALSILLVPHIVSKGHIIFTTSITRKLHKAASISLNETENEFAQLATYGRSKAALTLFAMDMARCHTDLIINCTDPGVVDSNLITMHRWYDKLSNIIFRPLIYSPRKASKATFKALKLDSSSNIVTCNKIIPSTEAMSHDQDECHLISAIRSKIASYGIF